MMPHIIYLLLFVSSPTYIRGDESGSWGSLSSGPSESECRPYIEKALQQGSNSIQENPEQPLAIDDVGEEKKQSEEDAGPSEVSENVSSESSSDVEGSADGKIDEGEVLQDITETAELENKEEASEEAAPEIEETASTEPSAEIKDQSVESGETSSDVPSDAVTAESNEIITETETEEIEEKSEETKEEESDTEAPTEQNTIESEESLEVASTEESNQENTEGIVNQITPEESEASGETVESLETIEEAGTKEIVESAEGDASEEKIETIEKDNNETSEDASEETLTEQSLKEDDKKNTEEEVPSSNEGSDEQGSMQEVDKTTHEEETEKIEPSGEQGEESAENSEPTETVDETSESVVEKTIDKNLAEESSEDTKEVIDHELPEESHIQEEPHTEENSGESIEKLEVTDEVSPKEEASSDPEEVASENKESIEEILGEQPPNESQSESENVAEEEEVPTEGDEVAEPATPEEELSMLTEVPENLRSREHMAEILRLNEENEETEKLLAKTSESTLRELKKLYEAAIKPLEILYKYRDLSNRHFGEPEIFSKPLILFMGPWSGGKSTIINYLLENEYKNTALRSGAEPSPAYFNIVMWGEREEILDGTQLAADWTFSGLQKFGQGLLDRLRGLKLNHPLLQKVNIVEIPGILEIRKQVERLFPFNDACQWFIDRADIIFLVYDPSKLDVGPETEAILDQLKGREMQTRIILNKADQVKPEELMRVQGTLIWNISPLMSSTEPPVMYSTSLWSLPYESGAPARLLHAHERAFLKDLRDAMDKRVENKIASARRFAVRVRNHAKMVDCYLTTYYNHKSFFGNKKKISDDIIEHPQNYHIYEGLSTLTNISRYDLPDPDVYRDFFRLNPVYEFQQLSSTCTYFRGCPINRLDVAIAYDLPELVGKYKKQAEDVLNSIKK